MNLDKIHIDIFVGVFDDMKTFIKKYIESLKKRDDHFGVAINKLQ